MSEAPGETRWRSDRPVDEDVDMDDAAFRAAIETADTYKAAADAVGLPYSAVYDRAKKLDAKPKRVAARKERARPAPRVPPPVTIREPAPEATPPRLSAWIPLPDGIAAKSGTVRVRIEQTGRVRAAICNVHDGWGHWEIYDVTGARVGKFGLRGGQTDEQAVRNLETGADEALKAHGWLPDTAPAVLPCDVPTSLCERGAPPGTDRRHLLGALCVAFGAAAEIAIRSDFGEDDFAKVARWCYQREARGRELGIAA